MYKSIYSGTILEIRPLICTYPNLKKTCWKKLGYEKPTSLEKMVPKIVEAYSDVAKKWWNETNL